MKKLLFLLVLAALGGGGWYGYRKLHAQKVEVAYRTATIKRDTLVQEIRATGTIQPIKQVEVGTQVNGRILKLYVDFNSIVTTDQIVALIDPAVYEATHAKDCAQLKSNEANVEQIRVKLSLAEKDFVRKAELAKRNMLSASDLDTALAERDALAAQLKISQAAVEQSKASVKLSKTNLDYCTIRSPVNGVVIARNVDEGQTVVSSMNAQKLFQIATDLKRIQVEASIPEADVGVIRTNQPVSFTVDAYHDTFRGVVKQIRLAAATVQNVVTYDVVILVQNPEMILKPGMTANVTIITAMKKNVLLAPNAALRFQLSDKVSKLQEGRENRGHGVWVLENNKPKRIAIAAGIGDGSYTEVLSGNIKKDDEVIVSSLDNKNKQEGLPTGRWFH